MAKFSFLCKPEVSIICFRAVQPPRAFVSLTPHFCRSPELSLPLPSSVTDFIHPTAALPANSSPCKRAAQAHGLRMQESPCPPRVLAVTSALTHRAHRWTRGLSDCTAVIWHSWVARKCTVCLSWHGLQTPCIREGCPMGYRGKSNPPGAMGTGMAVLSLGHTLGAGPRVQQWGWDRASMKIPFVEAL